MLGFKKRKEEERFEVRTRNFTNESLRNEGYAEGMILLEGGWEPCAISAVVTRLNPVSDSDDVFFENGSPLNALQFLLGMQASSAISGVDEFVFQNAITSDKYGSLVIEIKKGA
jgi:hypothetical protein